MIQSDDEASIKALVKAVLKELGGLQQRVAPTGSSQSQGSAERYHQTLFAQARVLRIAVVQKYNLELGDLTVSHPVFSWMVKRAAWLLNRFSAHDDGKHFIRETLDTFIAACNCGVRRDGSLQNERQAYNDQSRCFIQTWHLAWQRNGFIREYHRFRRTVLQE